MLVVSRGRMSPAAMTKRRMVGERWLPSSSVRSPMPVVILGVGGEDDDEFGFGEFAGGVGYGGAAVEEFAEGFGAGLGSGGDGCFAVGGFGVVAVAGEDPVGFGVDEVLDGEGEFADELAGDVGDVVGGGDEAEVVVGGVGGGVVAAVLVELLGDASDFLGPAFEGGDLGEFDEWWKEVHHCLSVAAVGGPVEGADVLPSDRSGGQGVCEVVVAGVEALGEAHAGRRGVAGLVGAVGVPGVGVVAVDHIAHVGLGDVCEQDAFAVVEPGPLRGDRDQFVQLRGTLGRSRGFARGRSRTAPVPALTAAMGVVRLVVACPAKGHAAIVHPFGPHAQPWGAFRPCRSSHRRPV
ncbi:MAG: hypothetical protein R2704_09935 [Microthrixaceae bacterium]